MWLDTGRDRIEMSAWGDQADGPQCGFCKKGPRGELSTLNCLSMWRRRTWWEYLEFMIGRRLPGLAQKFRHRCKLGYIGQRPDGRHISLHGFPPREEWAAYWDSWKWAQSWWYEYCLVDWWDITEMEGPEDQYQAYPTGPMPTRQRRTLLGCMETYDQVFLDITGKNSAFQENSSLKHKWCTMKGKLKK